MLHILIGNQEQSVFHVEGGPTFETLTQLTKYYKLNPLMSGSMLLLNHPFHSTSFPPANILQRISQLEEPNQGLYGKSGFWEEFEVCTWVCTWVEVNLYIPVKILSVFLVACVFTSVVLA